MKNMIALATLLMAAGAMAQSPSDLSFGDVNYFLKSGQFNLLADLNLDRNEFQEDDGSKSTTESEAYVTEARLGYGLADNLNAFIGASYLYKNEFEPEPTGPNGYNQDGLTNPFIGLNYRIKNQNSSELNWDVGVVGRVKIQDAERGSFGGDGADGNAATGNNSLELNTSVGKKWNEANEWRLTVGGVYNFKGEYELKDATGKVDIETDTYTDFYARATYQYRPVYEFMMAVSVQATHVGERSEEVKSIGGLEDEYDAHTDFKLIYTAKYLFQENIMGRFNFEQSRLADIDVSSDAGDSTINRRRQLAFGLGVDFLF